MTTTFVLGAGASKPYEFPTADELKRAICDDPPHHTPSPWVDDPVHRQHFKNQVVEVARRLAGSGQKSIDAWLADNKQHAPWAKFAIASFLTPLEVDCSPETIDDWYSWFFRRYWRSQRLDLSNTRIVTFNYDRSFEIAMARMCMNNVSCDPNTVISELEQVMVHVYGALAWPSLNTLVSSRVSPTEDALLEAAKGIRTMFDERVETHEDVLRAREWLVSADHVVFLGFRFDPDNLKRIGVGVSNPLWRNTHSVATCVGLSRVERNAAKAAIGTALNFGDEQEKCDTFVENHVDWAPSSRATRLVQALSLAPQTEPRQVASPKPKTVPLPDVRRPPDP